MVQIILRWLFYRRLPHQHRAVVMRRSYHIYSHCHHQPPHQQLIISSSMFSSQSHTQWMAFKWQSAAWHGHVKHVKRKRSQWIDGKRQRSGNDEDYEKSVSNRLKSNRLRDREIVQNSQFFYFWFVHNFNWTSINSFSVDSWAAAF